MEQVAEKTKKMEIKISEAEGNSEREDICRGKGNMRSARAMSKRWRKKMDLACLEENIGE